MSRSVLRALDPVDLLNIDNLIFIDDRANDNASGGAVRSHGLDKATDHAPVDAIDLEIAVDATGGTLVAPDLPDDPGGPSASIFEINSGMLRHQPLELANGKRSGTSEGPTDGGMNRGGGDGGTNTTPTPFWSVDLGQLDTEEVDYYNITIEFYGDASIWAAGADEGGGYSGGFIDAFLGSAEFLTSMIMLGYADSEYFGPSQGIEAGLAGELKLADDLVIEAYLTDIDGVGGILGRAGAYDLPDSNNNLIYEGFPTAGLMEFDLADAENLLNGQQLGGLWNDVVLHEMMHVLGFGTLWGQQTEGAEVPDWSDLVDFGTGYIFDNETRNPNDDTTFYAYNGDEANNEALGLDGGGGTYFNLADGPHLAVERDGGAGTAGGHWDEVLYGNEIMTGQINSQNDGVNDEANYLADFTVAAFADLGYVLNDGGSGTVDYDEIADAGTEFLETGTFETWLT